MTVLPDGVQEFLDEQPVGVLATRSAAGRVHQSIVYWVRGQHLGTLGNGHARRLKKKGP
jgi:Pyridoxamine 5'-phosphate oxidase